MTEFVGGSSAVTQLDVQTGQTERLLHADENIHIGGNFGTYMTPWWDIRYYYDFGVENWWQPARAHADGVNATFGDGHAKFMKLAALSGVPKRADLGSYHGVDTYYWTIDKVHTLSP